MKFIPTLLFLLLIISACDTEKTQTEIKTEVDSLAAQLTYSATERFNDFIFGRIESTDSLEVSLTELDKAIEIEPALPEFYTYKANILLALGRDEQAIQVLKEALLIKPDYAEIITMIGFINEKIGEKEVAQKWYSRALEAYDKRIKEDRFVINSKLNKAFLLLFTEDEETARKALNKLKQEYPENHEVQFMEQTLIHFDKEQFLNELHH